MSGREAYLAARVLDALLREDYGRLSSRLRRSRDGVSVMLARGRVVRLVPGVLFQDFVVDPEERLELGEVLGTVAELAAPDDHVEDFARECSAALSALELHDEHREEVLARNPSSEALAAFHDHPIYPTSRAKVGMSAAELLAYAPEFAPSFDLRWAVVPGFPEEFPVHPLTVAEVRKIDGVRILDEPRVTVRPTLSMRTVELDARTHLKLPLPISTLGARNRRSIKPGTLEDGARAELLVRELADPAILVADEQTYAHAGHEYLAWMIRRLPEGEIIPVPLIPAELVPEYLRVLIAWNVRLFVQYGVALEAHQQNLSLLFTETGMKLLVKDNDGLLASPARLRAAGIRVPDFADERMLTDDPHALADVFVTITLHLAAAAVAFRALPHDRAATLLRDTLAEALDAHGDVPMAGLLRARTLDASRLTGKSMITAGTLVPKERSGARDVNKYYGTSGPNYLRRA